VIHWSRSLLLQKRFSRFLCAAHAGRRDPTFNRKRSDGRRIVVQDYYGNQVLATTEDLLSTSGWRELLADFVAGP
jgi:hypothetical protein